LVNLFELYDDTRTCQRQIVAYLKKESRLKNIITNFIKGVYCIRRNMMQNFPGYKWRVLQHMLNHNLQISGTFTVFFDKSAHYGLFHNSAKYSRLYNFDKWIISGLIEDLLRSFSVRGEEIKENHVAARSEYNPRAVLVDHLVPCSYLR
jgi:hypothetical protein